MTYRFENVFEFQDFCGRKYICGQKDMTYGTVFIHDEKKGLIVVGEWYKQQEKFTIIIY